MGSQKGGQGSKNSNETPRATRMDSRGGEGTRETGKRGAERNWKNQKKN